MPSHDYTAKEALNLLQAKIKERSPEFAERIQTAIDEGKEVLIKAEEPSPSGKGPKRKRRFWKTEPYTDEEALQVALTLIESHLVESRQMLNTSLKDFEAVGESPLSTPAAEKQASAQEYALSFEQPTQPDENKDLDGPVTKVNEPKRLAMESEPERKQEKQDRPDFVLNPVPEEELERLQALVSDLKEVTDFKGGDHGNAR
ncbi:MAG: hypothetical protein ACREKL_04795 [Chthoniobacterales bacterium]